MTTELMPTCEAPSVPRSFVRRHTLVEEPGRISAFVLELDSLFDCRRWERARARAAARRIAALGGFDPLWSEVLALEMAVSSTAREALATLGVLSEQSDLDWTSFRDSLDALEERPEARAALEALSTRFKLACISSRPRAEVHRLLRALDLDHLFDAVECSGDAPAEGDPLERVAAQMDEPLHACVLVAEPSSKVLESARHMGMQTVAITAGGGGAAVATLGAADLAVNGFGMVEALGAGADSRY